MSTTEPLIFFTFLPCSKLAKRISVLISCRGECNKLQAHLSHPVPPYLSITLVTPSDLRVIISQKRSLIGTKPKDCSTQVSLTNPSILHLPPIGRSYCFSFTFFSLLDRLCSPRSKHVPLLTSTRDNVEEAVASDCVASRSMQSSLSLYERFK